MKTFNFIVENRKIRYIGEQEVSVIGDANVDTFHFDFDAEWDNLNQKKILFIKNEHWYWANLDSNNSVVLPNEIYGSQEFEFGVTGKNTNSQLSTSPYWQTTNISIYLASGDPENLPAKEVWDIYTEEMLALVAQGQITLEECQSILESIQQIQTELEQLQETVESDVSTVQQLKTQIESDISEVNAKIAAFDTNFEEKLAAFNSNYTEKLNTFNSNAETKTTDFNTNAVNKKSDFDSNASNKKTDFNSNASSKKSDFNSNATSKTNSFNSNYDEKLASVNSAGTTQVGNVNTAGATQVGNVNTAGSTAVSNIETAENSAVQNIQNEGDYYANHIKALEDNFDVDTTPNSNDFTLTDSASGYIPRDDEGNPFEIKIGDGPELEQIQTTGKNLLDIEYCEKGSIDASTGEDVSNDLNARGSNYIEVLPDTQYTLSANTSIYQLRLSEYTQEKINIQRDSESNVTSLTITTTSTTKYLRWSLNYNNAVLTVDEAKRLDLQLEQGSTATTYEPYTNGEATPTPDYPQDITVVEGESSASVNNKNLWGGFSSNSHSGAGISWVYSSDGTIKADGTATSKTNSASVSYALEHGLYVTLPAGNYFITGGKSNDKYLEIYTSGSVGLGSAFGSGKAITLTKTTGIIIRVVITNGTTVDNETFYIQIEKGSSATSYVPHKGQTDPTTLSTGMFLGSIGTASNYIYGTKDNWKLHSGLGKAILNGSEDWSVSSDVFYISSINNYGTQNNAPICNYLLGQANVSGVSAVSANHICFKNSTSPARLYLKIDNITTTEALVAWLSTHNIELYYKLNLSAVTDTDITDTALIAQLNNIADNLQTYKGGTVVFTTSDNLEPNIQFDYMVNPFVETNSRLAAVEQALVALNSNN